MDRVKNLAYAYSLTPWRKQLKTIVLFLIGIVFAALIAGIYLDVTARAATMGREILFMETEIENMKLVTADLETNLANLISASEMEKRALGLGFVPIEKEQINYVVVPGYQPRQSPYLAPPSAPVTVIAANLPSDYTQSLFDWFEKSVVPYVSRLVEVTP